MQAGGNPHITTTGATGVLVWIRGRGQQRGAARRRPGTHRRRRARTDRATARCGVGGRNRLRRRRDRRSTRRRRPPRPRATDLHRPPAGPVADRRPPTTSRGSRRRRGGDAAADLDRQRRLGDRRRLPRTRRRHVHRLRPAGRPRSFRPRSPRRERRRPTPADLRSCRVSTVRVLPGRSSPGSPCSASSRRLPPQSPRRWRRRPGTRSASSACRDDDRRAGQPVPATAATATGRISSARPRTTRSASSSSGVGSSLRITSVAPASRATSGIAAAG